MTKAKRRAILSLFVSLSVGVVIAHATSAALSSRSLQQIVSSNGAASSVLGEVTEIDPSSRRLSIKTAEGQVVAVLLGDKAELLRVPPGEKSLEKGVKIEFAQVGVGDKAYAVGAAAADKKSVLARKLILMSKTEIQQRNDRESADWQKRGVGGVITALNPAGKAITMQVRTRAGAQAVVVTVADSVQIRRYRPDSVKFSDARAASFADLKVGDQIRVLGEKAKDGPNLEAEQIVSGSFRTVGGAVTEVNAETGEVKIAMLGTRQPLTIVVNKNSMLRLIPPQVAIAIARASQAAQGAGAGNPGQSAGDLEGVLERLPPLTLSQLKPGAVIAVSSTVGADPSRLTAIALISGVDGVLTAMQKPGARPAPLVVSTGLPAGVLDFVIGQP
jgi:hypothetical protein